MSLSSIRVLVVDDSAVMRKLIPQLLARDPEIEVVATAMDGEFALKRLRETKVDVVTLDLDMPRVDGMQALREIVRAHGVPVIVFSALAADGSQAAIKALSAGAVDFITKPPDLAAQLERVSEQLVKKIRKAAAQRVRRSASATDPGRSAERNAAAHVIAIGVSTGGPHALQELLSMLPADFPASLLVVQHMPEGFTEMFAQRLNHTCALEVREATSGDLLVESRVLICPGNRHMRVRQSPLGNVVTMSDDEKVSGHRPSVDVLFRSVAGLYGPQATGLLLTGMGQDGAEGLGAIRAAGGFTVAQDEASCVVFGMPKAAIAGGHAMRVMPLEEIPSLLLRRVRERAHVFAQAGEK